MSTNLGPGGTQNMLGPGGTQKKTSGPLFPDTPWWANLITAVATALVSVLGTVYALGGLKGSSGTGLPPAAGIIIDTITYMPHILLLFGVLGDMFTYQGVWSIPSLIGLLSIFFHYFMQYFWKGLQELYNSANNVAKVGSTTTATPPAPATLTGGKKGGAIIPPAFFKNYDGCSVQGFEGWKTEFGPQTLVVTATVFSYYALDLIMNRGWVNAAATLVIFFLVYAGQVGVLMMTGGCGGQYGNVTQALMAFFEGLVFGGSSYGIVQTYYPTRLPSSTISPFPRRTRNDLTVGPDGNLYDEDGNIYVCLPNGQCMPDLSTQKSRDAFAKIAGENIGTGLPAKGDSCPNA